MVEDRLNEIVSRMRVMREDYDRELEEERRREEEAAERRLRVTRGWQRLRTGREQVVDDINTALHETGVQLRLAEGFESENDDHELDYLVLTFQGLEHPQLGRVRLRVCLKDTGMIAADVLTDAAPKRLKRLTYEEFTMTAWRNMIYEHIELALSGER